MVSFARARTKSWLSKLWPVTAQPHNPEKVVRKMSKDVIENQYEQNKSFFAAIKNGGMWFS